MIRIGSAFAFGALFLGASIADAQPRGRLALNANPSAVVKAELAFARLAQDKGQWTAFRETADKDAVMFVPDAVNAQAWLKGRADPPKAIAWKPYRIFSSCDGSYAVSTGPWTQPDGKTGTFNTLWRRQKDGGYKWVVDFGSDTRLADQDEPMIEGKVADCPGRVPGQSRSLDDAERRGKRPKLAVVRIAIPPPQSGAGQSDDGSLSWTWTSDKAGQAFEVTMLYQGDRKVMLREAAPSAKP